MNDGYQSILLCLVHRGCHSSFWWRRYGLEAAVVVVFRLVSVAFLGPKRGLSRIQAGWRAALLVVLCFRRIAESKAQHVDVLLGGG